MSGRNLKIAREHNRGQYDSYASHYHRKRQSKREAFYNEFIDLPAIKTLLRGEIKSKKVLDVGCGSGILCEKLRLWGGAVTGLDNSRAMLEIAARENPGIRFICAEADSTGLPVRSFDTVVSELVAHYFKDVEPLFCEAARVLKKGGVLVFSFHHPFNEILRFKTRGGKISAAAAPYFRSGRYVWKMAGRMKLISYHHTMEEIFEALAAAGFTVERLLEPRPAAGARKYSPEAYALTSRYPSFCAIKARKISAEALKN